MYRNQVFYSILEVPTVLKIGGLFTAFEAIYEPNYQFEGETHDFWECVCVLEGNIGATSDEKVYELGPNQWIFHRPMEFHRLWNAGNTKAHLIIFSFTGEIPEITYPVFRVSYTVNEQISKWLKNAKQVFRCQGPLFVDIDMGFEMQAALCVKQLEYLLLSVISSQEIPDVADQSGKAQNFLDIVQIMKAHLSEKLSVNDIAALCHMSQSQLKKSVLRFTGNGVLHHFNLLKMQKAISLLEAEIPVSEVARQLGFSEPAYFSTVFKRFTGYAPTHYRKPTQK